MRLAYDIANTLPTLRREAEARMVDTCRLSRPEGAPTFDPTTGEWTPATSTPYYEGPCEVQASDSLMVSTAESGEQVVTISRVTLKVPVAVTGVEVDDLAEITETTWDPELAGTVFRVTADHTKTYATARRLRIERVES